MVTRYAHANTDQYREGINALPSFKQSGNSCTKKHGPCISSSNNNLAKVGVEGSNPFARSVKIQ
jgi:hypothetical protein